MAKLQLSFACGLYDRMQPLYTGEVKADGIDLNFIAIDQPRPIFDRMAAGEEFDVAEFSSSEFVQRFANKQCPFVAIPIFPSRAFRHGFIAIHRKADIKTPKDLEGKSIALTPGSAQFQQWPAFAKGCGVDASKVRVVSIDPAGTPPALIAGQVPAIAGFAQGQVPTVEIRGNKKTRVFWYADCGVDAVSNGIVVHNDLIKEDPALIKAFVAASLKGFLYGRQHPDEMVAIAKKFSPTIEPAVTLREAELSWQTWVTPNTAGKPLGWMAQQDWEHTVEVLKQYGGVTTPLEAEQLYTNAFVPTGAEFLPPPPPNKT